MQTAELIERIRGRADAIRAAGVTGMYIFGSRARGNARPESDLDAFIDFDASRKFSLIDLVGVQSLLERELGLTVDLTTRNSLNPRLRSRVEAEAIRVI
jgi:predicted nucleotidyltransferase